VIDSLFDAAAARWRRFRHGAPAGLATLAVVVDPATPAAPPV
jgi:hypothetical protein